MVSTVHHSSRSDHHYQWTTTTATAVKSMEQQELEREESEHGRVSVAGPRWGRKESKWKRAMGRVKDQASITVAKLTQPNQTIQLLQVSILKATLHDPNPPSPKHLFHITQLTFYSPALVRSCATSLFGRLHRTSHWHVALKALLVAHRLISLAHPSCESHILRTTRRGRRLLDMRYFGDPSRSDLWDFTVLVRSLARYLELQLELRTTGGVSLRAVRPSSSWDFADDDDVSSSSPEVLADDFDTEQVFDRCHQLQQLLEGFLACRPKGKATSHMLVATALESVVEESFSIYWKMGEIMTILIERFMRLDVPDCLKVVEIFSRASSHFSQLHDFYQWSSAAGIATPSDYPRIDPISPDKLSLMHHFIRQRTALARSRIMRHNHPVPPPPQQEMASPVADIDGASPACTANEDIGEDSRPSPQEKVASPVVDRGGSFSCRIPQKEATFLTLNSDEGSLSPPGWETFSSDSDTVDWETELMRSATQLFSQKVEFPGGGFDEPLLDDWYQTPSSSHNTSSGASATSAVFSAGSPDLIKVPEASGGASIEDPFVASLGVAAPTYVLARERRRMAEEQAMWEQRHWQYGMRIYTIAPTTSRDRRWCITLRKPTGGDREGVVGE